VYAWCADRGRGISPGFNPAARAITHGLVLSHAAPVSNAVDAPQLPVELHGGGQLALKRREDAVPGGRRPPLARPPPLARRHGRPGPVPLGQIAPREAGGVAAEHAVENPPMIGVVRPRVACAGRRGAMRAHSAAVTSCRLAT
jgi:hypothetical protein